MRCILLARGYVEMALWGCSNNDMGVCWLVAWPQHPQPKSEFFHNASDVPKGQGRVYSVYGNTALKIGGGIKIPNHCIGQSRPHVACISSSPPSQLWPDDGVPFVS